MNFFNSGLLGNHLYSIANSDLTHKKS